jgi:hypothetical protein
LKIKITAEAALPAVCKICAEPEPTSLEADQEYSKEAFVELLESINIVESPRLRKIFLLLHKELQASDIPVRSTMRTHIKQAYEEHINQLKQEMVVNEYFQF